MTTVRKFVKDLETLVNRQIVEDSLKLSKGQCPDHAAYVRMCGVRTGMEGAVRIAQDMLKQIDDLEDLPEEEAA